jgi:hypothetical protein
MIIACIAFVHIQATKNQTPESLQCYLPKVINKKKKQLSSLEDKLTILKTAGTPKPKLKTVKAAIAKKRSTLQSYQSELVPLSDEKTKSLDTTHNEEMQSLYLRCTRFFNQSYVHLALGGIYAGLGYAVCADILSYLYP